MKCWNTFTVTASSRTLVGTTTSENSSQLICRKRICGRMGARISRKAWTGMSVRLGSVVADGARGRVLWGDWLPPPPSSALPQCVAAVLSANISCISGSVEFCRWYSALAHRITETKRRTSRMQRVSRSRMLQRRSGRRQRKSSVSKDLAVFLSITCNWNLAVMAPNRRANSREHNSLRPFLVQCNAL